MTPYLPAHVVANVSYGRPCVVGHREVLLQGCIVIHYGEGRTTSHTKVLGQLDLTGIPPAPKDVPKIEVKFILTAEHQLIVEVRDLDTERQKEWLQRGAVMLVKAGDATQGSCAQLAPA